MGVTVTAKDYSSYSPKTSAVGKVTFSVKNSGKARPQLPDRRQEDAGAEAREEREADRLFSKAGSFTYQSTVGDDAKKGMKGTFTRQGERRRQRGQEGLRLDRRAARATC